MKNRWDDFEGRGPGQRRQNRGQWGGPWGGPWGGGGPGGQWGWGDPRQNRGGGPGGPPPWVAELFGWGRPQAPRARRGDVRTAILAVLNDANQREESPNGYQVIQAITERSGGAWKPSPGSVYPTLQQLEDEGLVDYDGESSRRSVRLSTAGAQWCAEHVDELAAVWAPFGDAGQAARPGADTPRHEMHKLQHDVKDEIRQVASAIWQIVTQGSDAQRRAGLEVLVEARRKLYGILADGREGPAEPDNADADPDDA